MKEDLRFARLSEASKFVNPNGSRYTTQSKYSMPWLRRADEPDPDESQF